MKEKSIVLNMMQGEPGDILEKGRYYAVKKQSDGLITLDTAIPHRRMQH